MASILLAYEADREKGEARLHEEDQISGLQRPGKVCTEADVANIVGEFRGEWLARNLQLIRVVRLFCFGVVRRCGRSPVDVPDGSGFASSARAAVTAPKATWAKNSAIIRRSVQHLYVDLNVFTIGPLLLPGRSFRLRC